MQMNAHAISFHKFSFIYLVSLFFRKLKRQRERLCRYVYNQILTAECTQLNGTWPDPDDPRWSSGEYGELLPEWFPTNATDISIPGNITTPMSLGNVNEIKELVESYVFN